MKRAMITVLTMAILSSALILSGCAALVGGAAAGAGTYVWTQGSMEREYQASLDQTYDSTVQALQEMGMTIEEQDKGHDQRQHRSKDGRHHLLHRPGQADG
jgi:uncharacterized protein HemX